MKKQRKQKLDEGGEAELTKLYGEDALVELGKRLMEAKTKGTVKGVLLDIEGLTARGREDKHRILLESSRIDFLDSKLDAVDERSRENERKAAHPSGLAIFAIILSVASLISVAVHAHKHEEPPAKPAETVLEEVVIED